MEKLEEFLKLKERRTSVKIEVLAGITMLMTVAYVLVVQPGAIIGLGDAVFLTNISGLVVTKGVITITCAVTSTFTTLLMGFYANLPPALATGMGTGPIFGALLQSNILFSDVIMAITLISGLIFVALIIFGIRGLIVKAIPENIKMATGSVISSYIAYLGFKNSGIGIFANGIKMGSFKESVVFIALLGLVIIVVLTAYKVNGAVLIGIVTATVMGIPLGIITLPDTFAKVPDVSSWGNIVFYSDFKGPLSLQAIIYVFTIFRGDFSSTLGTALGVVGRIGMLDEDGNMPETQKLSLVDAIGTRVGTCIGNTTITTSMESTSGVEAGSKTGLASIVVAVLFAVAVPFSPLILTILDAVTGPALIFVGFLVVSGIRNVDLSGFTEVFGPFVMIMFVIFCGGIAAGIAVDILAYITIKTVAGKLKELHPVMYMLAVSPVTYSMFKQQNCRQDDSWKKRKIEMKIQPRDKRTPLRAALKEIKSGLVIKNTQLVNVIAGEIYPASVYVYDGPISHVEHREPGREGQSVEEAVGEQGKCLILGLIDAHEHTESSMIIPRNFAKTVIPERATTVITDPHEIENVWDTEGVRYMCEASEGPPIHQLIDISSCVSAVPGLEHAGAESGPAQIKELVKLERVVGLAKVMDYLDVIRNGDRMMDIIRTAEEHGLYLQGHAPFMEGGMLFAYLRDGSNTCHEPRTAEKALEKMRSGMWVDARSSSITKNAEVIWSRAKDLRFLDNFCLCTDNREADNILRNGHINDVVRVAMRYGMELVVAIKGATLNSAREAEPQNLGIVASGYAAGMLLVDDLRELTPDHAFCIDKLVAQEGRLLAEVEDKSYSLESVNSVRVGRLTAEDSTTHPSVSQGEVEVSLMKYYDMNLPTTDIVCGEVWVKDGRIGISGDRDLKFVAMVNRYEGNDNIALGLVRDFSTKTGTLAPTVSHDSHNLAIVHGNPERVPMAAEELVRTGGSMCAVKGGKIPHTLALPLAGLMSLKPTEESAEDSAVMKDASRAPSLTNTENPLLHIITLALPVISDAKILDMGLMQMTAKRIVPLFPE